MSNSATADSSPPQDNESSPSTSGVVESDIQQHEYPRGTRLASIVAALVCSMFLASPSLLRFAIFELTLTTRRVHWTWYASPR